MYTKRKCQRSCLSPENADFLHPSSSVRHANPLSTCSITTFLPKRHSLKIIHRREREQVRKALRRTSIKISLMAYDSPHVIHSLKTCSPFVVSGVNALDIRNISLSYHVRFFVCRVSRNFSWIQTWREAWNSGRYRSRNSIRSCTSASFIFGNFETDDWPT